MSDKSDISNAINKDIEFSRLAEMTREQRLSIISRKETEIFKALEISDKNDYKDAISTLLKSKYYLIIERLVLGGFTQISIANYIKENLTDDKKLSQLTVSTIRSYIAKLKTSLEKQKMLLKEYTRNPEKAEEFELRLESAVNEVELIGEMINLQKNRILEMRKEEMSDRTHNKEIKNEIKLIVSLVNTSSTVKEALGANQQDNRNALEIYKDTVDQRYSRILNKESSKNIINIINTIINIPHESNMIEEDELEYITPLNAPDVSALVKTQEKIIEGDIPSDKIFFGTPRKNSNILSVKGRDEVDYSEDKKDSRDFKENKIPEEEGNADIKEEDDYMVVDEDEDDLEDFE